MKIWTHNRPITTRLTRKQSCSEFHLLTNVSLISCRIHGDYENSCTILAFCTTSRNRALSERAENVHRKVCSSLRFLRTHGFHPEDTHTSPRKPSKTSFQDVLIFLESRGRNTERNSSKMAANGATDTEIKITQSPILHLLFPKHFPCGELLKEAGTILLQQNITIKVF